MHCHAPCPSPNSRLCKRLEPGATPLQLVLQILHDPKCPRPEDICKLGTTKSCRMLNINTMRWELLENKFVGQYSKDPHILGSIKGDSTFGEKPNSGSHFGRPNKFLDFPQMSTFCIEKMIPNPKLVSRNMGYNGHGPRTLFMYACCSLGMFLVLTTFIQTETPPSSCILQERDIIFWPEAGTPWCKSIVVIVIIVLLIVLLFFVFHYYVYSSYSHCTDYSHHSDWYLPLLASFRCASSYYPLSLSKHHNFP